MTRFADHIKTRERELDGLADMNAANDGTYTVEVTETSSNPYEGAEKMETHELGTYIEDQREVLAACLQAANDIHAETGFDALDDRVEDIGHSNGKKIGGVFHTGTKETKLDNVVAHSAVRSLKGVEQFKQVSLHERIHKLAHTNAEKRDEQMMRIVSEEFEEALCETATSLVTGEISAYKEYMGILHSVAAASGKSAGELARMYREGRFTELNMMYMSVYDKVAVAG